MEAAPAHKVDEINAIETMIERVEDRFQLKPDRLIGDTNYGTAELLGWMVDEKQIEPRVSVWDKTQLHDDTLSSSDFQWDEQADQYRCPQGQLLRRQWQAFKTCIPTSPRPTPYLLTEQDHSDGDMSGFFTMNSPGRIAPSEKPISGNELRVWHESSLQRYRLQQLTMQ